MKRLLCLLFISLFVFAGCGETGKKVGAAALAVGGLAVLAADIADDWNGKNFDEYVRLKGVPTSQYTDSSGNTTYAYVKMCPNNQGQEETNVVVDKNKKILAVNQVSSCK